MVLIHVVEHIVLVNNGGKQRYIFSVKFKWLNMSFDLQNYHSVLIDKLPKAFMPKIHCDNKWTLMHLTTKMWIVILHS